MDYCDSKTLFNMDENKLHLIYGITMGILLCACVGVNSKTKSLSEVHCIYLVEVGTYEKEEYKPDRLPILHHML